MALTVTIEGQLLQSLAKALQDPSPSKKLHRSTQHRASIEEERGSKEREEMGVRGGVGGDDDNNSSR